MKTVNLEDSTIQVMVWYVHGDKKRDIVELLTTIISIPDNIMNAPDCQQMRTINESMALYAKGKLTDQQLNEKLEKVGARAYGIPERFLKLYRKRYQKLEKKLGRHPTKNEALKLVS